MKNVWLYSANYTDAWWVYDPISTERLNKMYRDYTLRKIMQQENNLNSVTLTSSEYLSGQGSLTNSSGQSSLVNLSGNGSSMNSSGNSSLINPCNNGREKKITEISSDHVMYEDNEEDNLPTENGSNHISYTIYVGKNEYYIDLDRMKQINISDINRQRNIKRVEVPKKLSEKQVVSYLRNNIKLNIKTNVY
jgi:hypothetical protein